MDSSHLDRFARALAESSTRRRSLGFVASLAAIASWGIDATAAKKPKRKRRQKRRDKRKKRKASAGKICAQAGKRTCDQRRPGAGEKWGQCNLKDAGLVGAPLSGLQAGRASFAGAHLLGVDLSGAQLKDACFAGASLRGANLRGVVATGADLGGADLCGADLREAKLTARADVCCSTRLPDGSSAAPCADGQECCGAACTDLRVDPGNCGACGNICTGGDVCCDGACVAPVGGGRCGVGDPACLSSTQDLQQAFDAAQDSQTIHLCAGAWELSDTLLIDTSLSIFGPTGGCAILSGQGENQVVGIRPNINVIFGNVTFTQGNADEGAGIFNQGSLALYDCTVTENEATFGAGIYNEGNLYLYNTTVSQNAVKKSSSEFDPEYDGGGIYNDEGTVVLYGGTVITGNTANDETQKFGFGGGSSTTTERSRCSQTSSSPTTTPRRTAAASTTATAR